MIVKVCRPCLYAAPGLVVECSECGKLMESHAIRHPNYATATELVLVVISESSEIRKGHLLRRVSYKIDTLKLEAIIKTLVEGGLVTTREEGRSTFYSVTMDGQKVLTRLLTKRLTDYLMTLTNDGVEGLEEDLPSLEELQEGMRRVAVTPEPEEDGTAETAGISRFQNND